MARIKALAPEAYKVSGGEAKTAKGVSIQGMGVGDSPTPFLLATSVGPAQGDGNGLQAGGGEPCGSLLDTMVTSARTREIADRQDRRVCRFYHRTLTGAGVGGRLRLLTLTSSDEAVGLGKDIHRAWRALLMRLRRRYGRLEYIGVRERKGGRVHLHLCYRGPYLEHGLISRWWAELHLSPVVDVRAITTERGAARYMAKYLAKASEGRYWASYGWCFRGWVGWSNWVHKVTGMWPRASLVQALSRLTWGKLCTALEGLAARHRIWYDWVCWRGERWVSDACPV